MPKLIVFDLDGTLARSKQPLTKEMAALMAKLLARTKVAVVSGGALRQFLTQVVGRLPKSANLSNLYLLPTSGAALFAYATITWNEIYEEKLTDGEATLIASVIREVARETGLVDFSTKSYGERIEFRGSEVTFSALGQQAPIEEKEAWDPDKLKRHELQEVIAEKLPAYHVAMGGATSIDITKRGVDKAFGIRKLSGHLQISISEMLYVGDELVKGGNDEVVKETGIQTKAVANPSETESYLKALIRKDH